MKEGTQIALAAGGLGALALLLGWRSEHPETAAAWAANPAPQPRALCPPGQEWFGDGRCHPSGYASQFGGQSSRPYAAASVADPPPYRPPLDPHAPCPQGFHNVGGWCVEHGGHPAGVVCPTGTSWTTIGGEAWDAGPGVGRCAPIVAVPRRTVSGFLKQAVPPAI